MIKDCMDTHTYVYLSNNMFVRSDQVPPSRQKTNPPTSYDESNCAHQNEKEITNQLPVTPSIKQGILLLKLLVHRHQLRILILLDGIPRLRVGFRPNDYYRMCQKRRTYLGGCFESHSLDGPVARRYMYQVAPTMTPPIIV